MILRKLAGSLRKQDWFTVVLEITIVVVGIFIGLQVDSWNNERKDREAESQILTRLHADMVGTLEDQRENADWDQQRIEAQEVLLRSLRSGELKNEDRKLFDEGLMFLGQINPLRLRWATVEELKSTGTLTIIRSTELRGSMGILEANYQRYKEINADHRSELRAHRIETKKRFEAITYEYGGAVEIRYDFEALVADPEFLNVVSNAHARARSIIGFHQLHIRDVEKFRDQVAGMIAYEESQSP